MRRPLFVGGCGQRSGTTAFADYLNEHQQILICRERYRHDARSVNPSFFTFERILSYDEEVTNRRREYHARLLKEKDPAKLKWIGDKAPRYVNHLKTLQKNNPGAHFIVLYRPVEEVAESFEARARDPQDGWLSENGFEAGVRNWNRALWRTRKFAAGDYGWFPKWNRALRRIREFVKVDSAGWYSRRLLIVDYHDFFRGDEACIALISEFLELEFDEEIRTAWKRMSHRFDEKRRHKKPLGEEEASFLKENKDFAAEEWILDRIERQYSEISKDSGSRIDRPANVRRTG